MKTFNLIFLFFITISLSAQTATIKGIVKNIDKEPIEGVSISYLNNGTNSDKNGAYLLNIPANIDISISFSHVSYKTLQKKVNISKNKTFRFSPTLITKIEEISEVVIEDFKKDAEGIVKINTAAISKIPGANQGVENILMTLAGVNNNNELSTQYNVRGGNFDENLVYVNGIEVYRPFLVRSGQQEGLSFVNGAMVQNIKFSAGGFQAKYGDKLSSVLDISYRVPQDFGVSLNASLLGGSLTLEGVSPNKKLSALVGFRYRNNSLFINSKDIQTNTNPNFTDVQAFLTYILNPKLKIDFLGNYYSLPKLRVYLRI